MRPLAIFFLAGCALFGIKRSLHASEPLPLRVHAREGASAVEVERAVERALLAELGLKAGAPLRDPVIRERLSASLRGAGAPPEDAALLRQATELGLWHEDALIEARLAMVGELKLRPAGARKPTDAELLALRDAHPERYLRPERVSFVQVLVARDRHGPALRERAEQLRARLVAEDCAPEAARVHADPSNLPARVVDSSYASVAARFGAEFAEALAQLAPGSWSEPLASAFGLHLVWLSERRPAGPLELAAARVRLLADFREQAARQELARKLAALRADYAIEVLP